MKTEDLKIIELSARQDLLAQATDYFWKCWGSDSNFIFYKDCIQHSIDETKALPKFYIVLHETEIIASYALLTNDIISRQDLMPWFACLFVNEDHRLKGIAEKLLNHALKEAKSKGYDHLYLSSDLVNFYEKKGWNLFGTGYNVFGEGIKIYTKLTSEE